MTLHPHEIKREADFAQRNGGIIAGYREEAAEVANELARRTGRRQRLTQAPGSKKNHASRPGREWRIWRIAEVGA